MGFVNFAVSGVGFYDAGLLLVREEIVARRFVVERLMRDFLAMCLVRRNFLFVQRAGACERLAWKHLNEVGGRRRIRRGSSGLVGVRIAVVVLFEIFEDVADVQEGIAIEADIDESRLHAGEDAGDFAFVDAADERELFFALDVNFD
jgi:hypothetical protein